MPPSWFSKFLLWKGEQGLYFLKAACRCLYFNVASFYVINLGKLHESERERESERGGGREGEGEPDAGLEPGGAL